MNDNTNGSPTTPATESQHPRTNEGACESATLSAADAVWENNKEWTSRMTQDAIAVEKVLCAAMNRSWQPSGMSITTLIDDLIRERDEARAQLTALEARYALDMETFATGSRMNAAVLDSTRARITEIVDAVKAERECETALDMAKETSNYASWDSAWRKWQDAKALTDAMVRKHEGVSVVGESISYEALHREGWAQDENGLNWPINGCDSVSWDFDDETVFVSSPVTGWMKAPGARTMADIHTLVRLFTAPDEAGTR